LPNAQRELGTLKDLRIRAQREPNADFRKILRTADDLVTGALLQRDPEKIAALAASGIQCRIYTPEDKVTFAEAVFDGLRNCVGWQ